MVETQNFRFIPAGAGNTAPLKICTKAIAVYPRWRGEHYFCNAQRYSRIGLSPLARGTLAKQTSGYAWCRFIPAGAGNTSCLMCRWPGGTVYPRWRGEHPFIFVSSWRDLGLSPLARGTRTKYPSLNPRRRFIPAGAGNTWRPSSFKASMPVYPRWRGEHSKHNLLLINDFLSQSQSTNFIVSHKQHIHYVKEYLIH